MNNNKNKSSLVFLITISIFNKLLIIFLNCLTVNECIKKKKKK